jgi:hypothetical protein
MSVEPGDREALVPRGQAFDGAHVSAAATAQHEGAIRQGGCQSEILLRERVLFDDPRLWIWERQKGGLHHFLAPFAPRPRHPHERGRKASPAGVALVVAFTERDRCERAAVRTPCPQMRHA